MSLEQTEAESAAVATAPRVTLDSMVAKIALRQDATLAQVLTALGSPVPDETRVMSVCFLMMENGFTVIGKAAPAIAANYNAELGRKFAYEDAVRQLWPLEGYLLRERALAGW